MERDTQPTRIEQAWPLYPGDLPSARTLRLEPRLRDLEHNAVFRALLKCSRSGRLPFSVEDMSLYTQWLACHVGIFLPLLLAPVFLTNWLITTGTFQRYPVLTNIGLSGLWGFVFLAPYLIWALAIGLTFRAYLSRKGRLTEFGLNESCLRSLSEMPDAGRMCAMAWWGRSMGRRRRVFLGITSFVLWNLAFVFILTGEPFIPVPFDFLIAFVLTLTFVSTALGPYTALLGVRVEARDWRDSLTPSALLGFPLGLIFHMTMRPGDLFFIVALPLMLFLGLFSGDPAISQTIPADGSTLTWMFRFLFGPMLPWMMGAFAGLYWGVATSIRCRRNADALLDEIGRLFDARIIQWAAEFQPEPSMPYTTTLPRAA